MVAVGSSISLLENCSFGSCILGIPMTAAQHALVHTCGRYLHAPMPLTRSNSTMNSNFMNSQSAFCCSLSSTTHSSTLLHMLGYVLFEPQ